MTTFSSLAELCNEVLLQETVRLAGSERLATAHLIAALAEIDARRLYLGEGCSSLFTYCTRVLHLSEHAAYGRIEAARLARRFPFILDLLLDGSLTLTSVTLLSPALTEENHREVLLAARHKSKRQIEEQVAALRPQAPAPPSIRKLPVLKRAASIPPPPSREVSPLALAAESTTLPQPPRPNVVKPLAPEQYKIQFTISGETHDKLRRVQDLLRHSIPNGDPATIFDKALTLLLTDIEKKKLAATAKPRGDRSPQRSSRHIPASVKRAVWKRDGGRCAFTGTQGRCEEQAFLEFHHVEPFAAGGRSTVENLELRCRAQRVRSGTVLRSYDGARTPAGICVRRTRSGPS